VPAQPEDDPADDEDPEASRRNQLAETRRLEAFSDGVLAIVITLLILDLHTPQDSGRMLEELLEQWPVYVAYAASFANVGVVWLNHHNSFTRLGSVDAGLLWRNLVLLLSTSILPFPTSVLGSAFQRGDREDQVVGVVFYALSTALVVASWVLVYSYLRTNKRLHRDETAVVYFALERRRSIFGLGACLLAAGVAFAQPAVGLAICWTITVVYVITSQSGAFRTRSG
jgi:uncharacterized membrane protein